MSKWMLVVSIVVLAACQADAPPDAGVAQREPPPQQQAPASLPPPQPGDSSAGPPAGTDPLAFVDRVWRVVADTSVQAGTTYVFYGDGTLIVEAPNGVPSSGSWNYRDGQLTMIEEGIAYPVDIVRMDTNHFTIRSHNPAGAVTIELMAAPDVPLLELQ